MEFRIIFISITWMFSGNIKRGGGDQEPKFQRNGDDSDKDGIVDNLWNNTS